MSTDCLACTTAVWCAIFFEGVWLYFRSCLSDRDVEERLFAHGICEAEGGLPDNKKGRQKAALDIPYRNSLWCLTIIGIKRGDPGHSMGAPSPEEKRPGRHAHEALLFFVCPLIRRVYDSARPLPRSTLYGSSLSTSRSLAPSPMIAPVRHNQSSPVIDGRRLGRLYRARRGMRTSNGLFLVLRSISTITMLCHAQQWLSPKAQGLVIST